MKVSEALQAVIRPDLLSWNTDRLPPNFLHAEITPDVRLQFESVLAEKRDQHLSLNSTERGMLSEEIIALTFALDCIKETTT